jgi:IS30 family transposase
VAPSQQTLRTGRCYRHKRGRGRTREGALKQCTNLKSIHVRPAAADARSQVGHWEGDLLVGAFHRSAVATLVDRKTRHTLLVAIRGSYSAKNVADALVEVFSQLPSVLRRTLTWDQGNEMFQHERIETNSGLRIYFADPHSPWQRPTNENTNGLLRQYFPKGTELPPGHQPAPARSRQRAQRQTTSMPPRPHTNPVDGTMATTTHHKLIRNHQ